MTIESAEVEEFTRKLSELSRSCGIFIHGSGDEGSPYLVNANKEPDIDGKVYDRLEWNSDKQEYGYEVIYGVNEF